MKLTKRSNGIYMVSYKDANGKRKRTSTGKKTLPEAQERALALLTEARRAAGDGDWTLSEALHDCYDRIWCKQKSSVGVLRRMTKLCREHALPDMLVQSIDYDQLVKFSEVLEGQGLKDATINRYLALISKALTEALKRGKLTIKPPFPYRAEPMTKLRWITKDEEALLVQTAQILWPAAEATAMVALIDVLVDTGARLTELLKAPRHSVGQVTFTDTKNGRDRSVPLTPKAQHSLPHVPLWTRHQATNRFTRLRDACDLPDVSLHTLRHTCASRLVQGGMDLYRVKTWLGHSSISVTERYAHLSPSHLTSGIEILTGESS